MKIDEDYDTIQDNHIILLYDTMNRSTIDADKEQNLLTCAAYLCSAFSRWKKKHHHHSLWETESARDILSHRITKHHSRQTLTWLTDLAGRKQIESKRKITKYTLDKIKFAQWHSVRMVCQPAGLCVSHIAAGLYFIPSVTFIYMFCVHFHFHFDCVHQCSGTATCVVTDGEIMLIICKQNYFIQMCLAAAVTAACLPAIAKHTAKHIFKHSFAHAKTHTPRVRAWCLCGVYTDVGSRRARN